MRFWDSSSIVPLLLGEARTPEVTAALELDAEIAVWWGTALECESAIERRRRERVLDAAGVRLARERLSRLASAWHEVPPSTHVRSLASRLLRTHPLRAADALQLAAALSLVEAGATGVTFLTADTRLAEAAEIEGLIVTR